MGASTFFRMMSAEKYVTAKDAYNKAVHDDESDNGRGNGYSGGPQTTNGFLDLNHLINSAKLARAESMRLMDDDGLTRKLSIEKRGVAGVIKAKSQDGKDVWCVFGWGAE